MSIILIINFFYYNILIEIINEIDYFFYLNNKIYYM